MKKYILSFFLLLYVVLLDAQSYLTIEECHNKARQNYPLINRYGLIDKATEYNLSNAGKGYLPQFSLSAKATLQTEVTTVPLPNIPAMDKDQYQATIDLNQTIWDGGNIRTLKQTTRAQAEVEKQQLNVDMYTLYDRVNNLFFGALLFDAQLQQNALLREDLERNLSTVNSYADNGLANQSDIDAVRVEILKTEQTRAHLLSGREAYLKMLSAMINEPIRDNTILAKPDITTERLSQEINRPELSLFNAQLSFYEAQKEQITASNMPRLSLFAQGGYGRPGLNMLDRDFSFFAIGGLRLSWNFGSLYTSKNDRKKLEVSQQNVLTQLETFQYNTALQLTQDNSEIRKIKKMIVYDNEIITLRENVRKSAEAKVANGTLTVVELMREVNTENLAKLDKISHDIELLMAVYKLKNTTGTLSPSAWNSSP